MDGLSTATAAIRSVLASAHKALGHRPTLLILDDFSHVPVAEQSGVLAYLHQVIKNLDIFLKICGVRHRLQPFVEGDPPRGMQVGQGAAEISLDITLERFQVAQIFLERVLAGFCTPLGVSVEMLITKGGRERLALGSGGVPRDYLHLVQSAFTAPMREPPIDPGLTTGSALRM
jgi:hypothetical protein